MHSTRLMFGRFKRSCPICGYEGYFIAAGNQPRFDACCPSCRSLERHREFAIWFKKNQTEFAGKRVLHFAPEPPIRALVRPVAATYRGADFNPGAADIVLNIEKIDLPDASVDTVICNHVLEHVDHRLALSELFRITVPGGLVILSFPIVEGWNETYEAGRMSSRAERELHYGQWDHIKYFGRDVRDHIKAAGFVLTEHTAVEPDVSLYSLPRGGKLFLARKPG